MFTTSEDRIRGKLKTFISDINDTAVYGLAYMRDLLLFTFYFFKNFNFITSYIASAYASASGDCRTPQKPLIK